MGSVTRVLQKQRPKNSEFTIIVFQRKVSYYTLLQSKILLDNGD